MIREPTIRLPPNLTQKGFENGFHYGAEIKVNELGFLIHFVNTHFRKRKGVNKIHSSYALKDIIERRWNKKISVRNGDLIAAMLICGYKYRKPSENSLICYFNIQTVNEKAIKKNIKKKKYKYLKLLS